MFSSIVSSRWCIVASNICAWKMLVTELLHIHETSLSNRFQCQRNTFCMKRMPLNVLFSKQSNLLMYNISLHFYWTASWGRCTWARTGKPLHYFLELHSSLRSRRVTQELSVFRKRKNFQIALFSLSSYLKFPYIFTFKINTSNKLVTSITTTHKTNHVNQCTESYNPIILIISFNRLNIDC